MILFSARKYSECPNPLPHRAGVRIDGLLPPLIAVAIVTALISGGRYGAVWRRKTESIP